MVSRRERTAGRLLLLLAGLYLVSQLPALYGEYRWFAALGYEAVFLKMLGYAAGLFLIATIVSFGALYLSHRLAARNLERVGTPLPTGLGLVGALVVALALGAMASGAWPAVLRAVNAVPFGTTDPVYGRDVGFYVYYLPLLRDTVGFLLLVDIVAMAYGLVLYAQAFGMVEQQTPAGQRVEAFNPSTFGYRLSRFAYGHVAAGVGAFLVLLGIDFALRRYALLFSSRGAVYGAGATDLTITRPFLAAIAVVGIGGGIAVLASRRVKDSRLFIGPPAAFAVLLIAGGILGAGYQAYAVEPDEFNTERPFIEREIDHTRTAFGLEAVDEREFPVSDTLTSREVQANPGTIENIRLWDWRPLLTTLNELQIFRTYYTFNDVDVDRYEIDGEETQVMVAAREIDFEALPPESQSWVNRHLVYTHGFGVTMSPVSKVSEEGLPLLYIKDIPPNSTVDIPVRQPRIYYGESTDTYALVNSGTRELDYPSGGQNVYTQYDGTGGVELTSTIDELVYSIKFGDPQIVLSGSVTRDTRLMFHRDIHKRVRTVAPFLEFDEDPYIVVANGRLYWIYDAYTTTDGYPYSQPIQFKGERTNYLRNSVKVVVDAHSGETTFYVAEPDDPLIQTYRQIFPELFTDIGEMPPALRDHVRYPQDAFEAQSEVYLTYHMTDPQVFYNKEDAWRVPDEILRGNRVEMEPYYLIMTFPDERDPEFVQIRPFIPRGKENMIGWLAARSDRPNYGNLRAFLFSKQRLVFGPMQIESRIDQDTEISQRITLWSQAGSNVIRGNLLAIPIEDTILYVEPLYLESQETGALPELKRVIVAQGGSLVMRPSLEGALAARFGEAEPERGPGGEAAIPPERLQRMRTLYREAQDALREGDLQTYARKIDQLGDLLDETGNTTATGPPPGTLTPAG